MQLINKLSQLHKRILFGVLMSLGMLGVLMAGSFAVKILALFLVGFLAFEWSQICKFPLKIFPPLIIGFVFSAIYATSINRSTMGVGVLLSLASLGVILSWLSWHRRFLWFALGVIYIGLPILSVFWLLDHLRDGVLLLSWIISLVVVNDVSAYFVGTWLRGPKLIETISPSKTWSGFLGGLLCACLTGGLLYPLLETNVSIQMFMGICGLIAFLSTTGDLFESKIKRIHKIKDSGAIIPGHGGIFDRVDGVLFVLPFIVFAIFLWPEMLLFSWKGFHVFT